LGVNLDTSEGINQLGVRSQELMNHEGTKNTKKEEGRKEEEEEGRKTTHCFSVSCPLLVVGLN
jgi:hypothetical protein